MREDWIPYRIQLLGNYATELTVKREVNRFLVTEDPCGMADLVRYGRERHELRSDMEIDLIVSFVGWMMDRFQDALLIEELDPGLFRHSVRRQRRSKPESISFLIYCVEPSAPIRPIRDLPSRSRWLNG
jgi:hypothetical protein